jgi:hypothetical protein
MADDFISDQTVSSESVALMDTHQAPQTKLANTEQFGATANSVAPGEIVQLSDQSSMIIDVSDSTEEGIEDIDDLLQNERPYPKAPDTGQSEYATWLG